MKKKTALRKFAFVMALVLFVTGFASFMVPFVTRWKSDADNKKTIEEYDSEIDRLNADPGNKLAKLYTEMRAYNEKIYANNQSGLRDQYSYQKPLFDLSDYGLKNDVFGYIYIPRLGVKLSLYLGASIANMAKGAVHLTYTSIPLDQDNTNAVIAAHRGFWGAEFFRNIQNIQIGDKIIIKNPWGKLTYQVTETRVINKDNIEAVHIQPGKKMLTLSTCHPLHQHTHRYLVFAALVSADQKTGA